MDKKGSALLVGLKTLVANIEAGNITAEITKIDVHTDNEGMNMTISFRGKLDGTIGGLTDSPEWQEYVNHKRKATH